MKPEYAKFKANFLLNDFSGICAKHGMKPYQSCVSADEFDFVVRLMHEGFLTRNVVKQTLTRKLSNG